MHIKWGLIWSSRPHVGRFLKTCLCMVVTLCYCSFVIYSQMVVLSQCAPKTEKGLHVVQSFYSCGLACFTPIFLSFLKPSTFSWHLYVWKPFKQSFSLPKQLKSNYFTMLKCTSTYLLIIVLFSSTSPCLVAFFNEREEETQHAQAILMARPCEQNRKSS